MGSLLDFMTFGAFNKFIEWTSGSSFKKLIGTVDFANSASDVFGVDDAIITSDGKIIEPSAQDTIIAAKPGGALAELFGALGLNAQVAPMAAQAAPMAYPTPSPEVDGTPASSAINGFLSDLFGLTRDPLGPADPQQQLTPAAATPSPANQTINVNVRIGERELKDIIKEVIPEAINSFSNP